MTKFLHSASMDGTVVSRRTLRMNLQGREEDGGRLDWKRVRPRIKQCSQLRRGRGSPRRLPTMPGKCTVSFANIVPLLCLDVVCLCARACIGNRSIPTFVSGRQWGGRARSIERRKRREYGFARTFFLSFFES